MQQDNRVSAEDIVDLGDAALLTQGAMTGSDTDGSLYRPNGMTDE